MSGSEPVDTAAIRDRTLELLRDEAKEMWKITPDIALLCNTCDRLRARNEELERTVEQRKERAMAAGKLAYAETHEAQQQRIEEALSLLREARLALIPGSPHEHPHIIVERIDAFLEQESTE